MDDMIDLHIFWFELAKWSQDTFGSDKVRGAQGPLKHLAKEVEECLAKPDDVEEYADLVFLCFDSARRAGFTLNDLRRALRAKLEKNKARQWPVPSSDEPVEHIREG